MSDDKMKVVQGGFGSTTANKAAISALRELAKDWAEYCALLAHLKKQSFDAYIGAGFTEAQALELCKGQGL